MSDVQISLVSNAFDNKPVNVSLSAVLERIRADATLKKQVLALRALRARDEKAYKAQKTRLPAVTFSGTFAGIRDAEHFDTPSGYMVCDVDGIQDAPGVRELVGCDEHVKAAFVSITGTSGVKFLVAIPTVTASQFHAVFNHVSAYFYDTYGIELDASGKDAPRLCFLSHDPEIVINDDSAVTPFEIDLTVDAPEMPIDERDERQAVTLTPETRANDDPTFRHAVLQVLTESAGVVNTYDDFFRVLAACKRENVPFDTFDAICQKSNGYNETGNLKAWTKFDASKHAGKVVSFGTLYAYATQTDEQRQRLNALLPTDEPTRAAYCVTDDMILQAAKPTEHAPNLLNVTRQTIAETAWMSDVKPTFSNVYDTLRTEVNAPCNYGKTAAIRKWLAFTPEKWVVILTPTTPLREQMCHDFPEFHEVKEGDDFSDESWFFVCTREKFVKSYPFDRLVTGETLVVIDEAHLDITDISYKSRMLADLQAKLDYCRTLELTGTPIRYAHHEHPATRYTRENAKPIDATLLYYTDTLPTIREIVKTNAARQAVPVFFLNDKDAIQEAGEMLLSYLSINTAERRPYLVYRDDTTREITPDAKILRDTAAIPADCLCILTTSLFEVGINVKSHAGTVALFPRHKDHTTRRQMLAVHLPCEVVQSVSRFRQGWDDLVVCIPSYQKCNRAAFDYDAEYKEHYNTAFALMTAYNTQRRAGKYYRHVASVRADISPEHRHYIRRDHAGVFRIYEQGIDFLLTESQREAMTGDMVYYAQELANEFTPVLITRIDRQNSALTAEEKAGVQDIRAAIHDRRVLAWEEELDRLAKPETTLNDGGNVSRAERWVLTFSRYIGKDNAVSLVRQTGDNAQKLQLLQRQARREKYLTNREHVPVKTFDAIDALVQSRNEWQSRDFMKAVKPILSRDPYLCRMLTAKSSVTKWTPNRAARILEGFAGVEPYIKKQDGATIRVYEIVTLTPFADTVLKATGMSLSMCFEWQKYCQIETLETPEQQAKTDEKSGYTFKKSVLYTVQESVTENDADGWRDGKE